MKVLEKTRENLGTGIGKDFLTKTPTVWEIIPGADKWNCMQLEDAYSKGNSHQREKTGHRMVKDLCQLYIKQGSTSKIQEL